MMVFVHSARNTRTNEHWLHCIKSAFCAQALTRYCWHSNRQDLTVLVET